MGLNKKDIIYTLSYFDIFDYPITHEQLWLYFPKKESDFSEFSKKVDMFNLDLYKKNNLISFRKDLISSDLRIKREKISKNKIKIANNSMKFIKYIPSIKYIGISGSLAMENSKVDDDIDLFIIVENNTMWTTRLVILLILILLRRRRKYNQKDQSDSICVNFILDENNLKFSKSSQDIYIAHEIIQLRTLIDRNNTYKKFLLNNIWIRNYLPNIYDLRMDENIKSTFYDLSVFKLFFRSKLIIMITKYIQMYFIKKHRTKEVISDHKLAFYPYDYRKSLLSHIENRFRVYYKKYEQI